MMRSAVMVFVFTLSACGIYGTHEEPEYLSVEETPYRGNDEQTREQQMTAFLKKTQDSFLTACDNPEACPANVAQFVYVKVEDLGDRLRASTAVCTSSLISSDPANLKAGDTMVLNSHCLPENWRVPGTDCSKNVVFHFADGTKAACDHVIWASTISEGETIKLEDMRPDVALLKLQRAPGIPAFLASRAGLVDREKLTAYKIDPPSSSQSKVSLLKKDSCEANQKSTKLPDFAADGFGLGFLTGCSSIHGNSGSPLVAGDGSVRAVLFGGPDPGVAPTPYIWATNLSCLRNLSSSDPWDASSPLCPLVVDATISREKMRTEQYAAKKRDFENDFRAWLTDYYKSLKFLSFQVKFDNSSPWIEVRPKCFYPSQKPSTNTVALETLPAWKFQRQVDERYHLDQPIERSTTNYRVEIDVSRGVKVKLSKGNETVFNDYLTPCQ